MHNAGNHHLDPVIITLIPWLYCSWEMDHIELLWSYIFFFTESIHHSKTNIILFGDIQFRSVSPFRKSHIEHILIAGIFTL